MKAYRILISLALCLAMLLGMCASAETLLDAGLTLRNVCIRINGEEIALPHEARLNALVEEDGAKLHFELGRGAAVLLPLSGEIDESGVRFSLGHSGRVYALDMDVLAEAIGLDMDDASNGDITMVADFLKDYFAVFEASRRPENQEKLLAMEEDMMTALTGSAGEEVEIEVNGAVLPVTRWSGSVSMNSTLEAATLVTETGIEEFDAYLSSMLEMMALALGAEMGDYDQFLAMVVEESGMDEEELAAELMKITCEIGGDDALYLERVTVKPADADFKITVEEIATPDRVDVSLDLSMEEYGEAVGLSAACTANLADGALSSFEANGGLEYCHDDSDGEYTYMDLANIAFSANGAVQDGLWSAELAVDYETTFASGVPGEEESISNAASFTGTYAESNEADGSVTSSIALNLGYGDGNYGLSFDCNVAKGAGLASLFGDGAREYMLNPEEYDLAYELMEIDAASLSADAMELSADESILRLMDKVEELAYAGYAEAYDYTSDSAGIYDYDYDYDASADYEDYEYVYEEEETGEVTYATVTSMEEAARYFGGEIPAFTPPEGYALDYVDVDAASLYAEYSNADGNYIGMMLINFGFDVSEMGDEVSYYEDETGAVYAAEFYSGSNYVMIQFDGASQEAAEAIVSGCAR